MIPPREVGRRTGPATPPVRPDQPPDDRRHPGRSLGPDREAEVDSSAASNTLRLQPVANSVHPSISRLAPQHQPIRHSTSGAEDATDVGRIAHSTAPLARYFS